MRKYKGGSDMHRDNVCLNGWWDFMPVYTENEDAHIVPYSVPTDGWLRKAYLVPGSWRKGEAQAETNAENKCREKDAPWLGFKLGDNFDYPRQWSYTKNAWIKREFFVDKKQKGKRLCLRFNGVMPEAYVFVNGVRVFRNVDRTMPFSIETIGITAAPIGLGRWGVLKANVPARPLSLVSFFITFLSAFSSQ